MVVSAIAHLGVGGYLVTHPAAATTTRVVTAEMIFTELPPPPKKEEPPQPVEPPKPIEPPKVATRPIVRQPRETLPPPPTPKEVTPPPPPQDVPRALVEDIPRAQPINLGLTSNSTLVLSIDAGVQREVEVVNGGGLHGLDAPKDLVGGLTKETLGRGRVDRGLVHPYYSQLGKALLKNWDAERVAQNGLKGLAEQTQQNLKLYNEMWAERAQQYATTGNPLGDVGSTPGRRAAMNDRVGGLPGGGVDLEQRKEMQKAMKEQFKAVRRAVIRVVQDREGKLLKVELVQPSQDANVDKEALTDVKNAAEKLPPPPDEAMEGKTVLSSLWTFELIVSISPPVPTFSFEFDEALGFIDARLPLDRRIYKKVRLYSVE